jgi:uncharacterized membrane protein
MKKTIVIRIRRKNEFNPYWAFLVCCTLIVAIASLMVRTFSESLVVMFAALIVVISALFYQGFEVIMG